MSHDQPTGYICPCCGYDDLDNPPYYGGDLKASRSFEICPSCGFQFGHTDDALHITHEQWRNQWMTKGMLWQSQGIKPPPDWNPRRQLLKVGVKL